MIDLEMISKILMAHKGKKNAIKAKEISFVLGLPLEDTQYLTRTIIRKAAEEYELPVVSSVKGYYIAETDDEIEEFNNDMQHRINGIERTRRIINNNYYKQSRRSKAV